MRQLHPPPSSFAEVLRRSEAACSLTNPILVLASSSRVLAAEAADQSQELQGVVVEILQAAAAEHANQVEGEEVFLVFPKVLVEELLGLCLLALRL